ncbi:MAG: hypothetical protein GVY36_04220 [Verrucomicrobia bacterium]|jgi:O-antigen ligase|nr:hypothetical protein [Verrucomicrobiota bacterium]
MSTNIDKHGNIGFFGKFTWGNFFDWLVTLCLGAIISMTALHLGGVRPDTLVALLPLYTALLCLHGLWLLLESENRRRLNYAPLWFLPALVWLLVNVLLVTPVPWLGWYEFIYALQAFIILWVLCNNVGSKAHLWVLLVICVSPVLFAGFNGFYQFFQNPATMVGAITDFPLVLPAQYLGRATGIFADPFTLAAFLLVLLPPLMIAAGARRLPKILRVFCFYNALMVMAVITFTQVYWAGLIMVVLVGTVPWFCYRKLKQRLLISFLGAGATALVLTLAVSFHPLFEKGLQRALAEDGEGVRIVLWKEALAMAAEHPVHGVGAGAYRLAFEQSPRVSLAKSPNSPHNDYLLVLSQLGIVGCVLLAAPALFIFVRSFRVLRGEPFGVKLQDKEGTIMPPKRFFLSIGLSGSLALALCMGTTFVFYVPAILLYGVLLLSILIKTSFSKKTMTGRSWPVRLAFCTLAVCSGFSFYVFAYDKLHSQSLELRATQELDHLVEMRVHLSGDVGLLDAVILRYEDALIADPNNVDALLGLSSALCQRYFRSPADFRVYGNRAVATARRAIELSPNNWRGWAQLGVAHAYNAQPGEAEDALLRALDLAPNSSQANYYYAAFIGVDASRRKEALSYVERALKINPKNSVARQLEQKLRIL